ncbi:hypothetical protein ACLK1V_09220 [Escherichia coli]
MYNDNPEVVTLAAHLMLLAAVYQISRKLNPGDWQWDFAWL